MKKLKKKDYVASKDTISMTPGEMVATLRKLQGLTQKDLAHMAKMTQANISSIESGRQHVGRERALALARALKVHPAVIIFPNYHVEQKAA